MYYNSIIMDIIHCMKGTLYTESQVRSASVARQKVKGTVVPEVIWGSGVIAPLIFNVGSEWR